MITVRKSEDRGKADHGWLNSRHTFSFADYHDSQFMGFRQLRVINEDRVSPGEGFGEHPHRDMEIISYVISGALAHKDSMGTGSVIRPGDVQVMSAGHGVTHSEFNHSKKDQVHFLQIWIRPSEKNLSPGYQQKTFRTEGKSGRLRLAVSGDGREGSVKINQDVNLYISVLSVDQEFVFSSAAGRAVWIQIVRGELDVNGELLKAGDGAAAEDEREIRLRAVQPVEFLLFDLS